MFWPVVPPPQGLGEEEATSAEPELYNVTILIRAQQAKTKMMRKILNKGPCRDMVVGPNLDHCLLSGEPYEKILNPLVVIGVTKKNTGLRH